MQNSKIIILDSGFWQMKIGFAGDEAPRYQDRNLIGYSKNNNINSSEEDREYYIGSDALLNKKLLNIQYPLSTQNECKFQNFEKIWHELFYNKMKIDIQDFPVFLTLSAFFDEKRKVELCELLFENFDVPAIYSSISNVTGLYGEGKTSGLVLDSGFIGTYALNVFEGYPVEDNTCYNFKGGNLLGQQMSEKVVQNLHQDIELQRIQNKFHKLYGYTFDIDYFDNLKPYCFNSNKDSIELLLPDENRVKINQEIFDDLKKQNFQNFADSISQVLNNTEEDYVDDFKSKIFLQGGNTLFPDTEQEVQKILESNDFNDIKIYQRTDDEKIYNSWIGASLFASLSSFSDIWITKQDYMEYGHYAILDRNLIQFFLNQYFSIIL